MDFLLFFNVMYRGIIDRYYMDYKYWNWYPCRNNSIWVYDYVLHIIINSLGGSLYTTTAILCAMARTQAHIITEITVS